MATSLISGFEAVVEQALAALKKGSQVADIPVPVGHSSAIGRAVWNPLSWDLSITFAGKAKYGAYVYPGVSPKTVLGLANAGSKGRYFHSQLKGKAGKPPGARGPKGGLGGFGLRKPPGAR